MLYNFIVFQLFCYSYDDDDDEIAYFTVRWKNTLDPFQYLQF